jgi:D-alanyl-D-alanine dipeptidase
LRAQAHEVSFDEPSLSDPRGHTLAASAIAFVSPDFVRPEAYRRHRASLSSEVVAAMVAAADFCLVSMAAAAAFAVYFDVMNRSAAQAGRYIVPTLFAATSFVGDPTLLKPAPNRFK